MQRELQTIEFWRGRLPHWELHDACYFVTMHLHGAVPDAALRKLRRKLAQVQCATQVERAHREYFVTLESYLESANDVSDLEHPQAAAVIQEAIQKRMDDGSWRIIAYVIMPNHVHLFFKTEKRLRPLLTQFKQWTARRVRKTQGRSGQFWQHEWFDHWSRSAEQDEKIVRYICNNPVKAGLTHMPEGWPYTYVRPK
jgi:REP element-mobilizing transposase RayT